MNALKHGLLATAIPISSMPSLINAKDYEAVLAALMEDYTPRTQVEVSLVETLAMDTLRQRRVTELDLSILEPPIQVSMPFEVASGMTRAATADLTPEQCELFIREFTKLYDDVKSGLPPDIADETVCSRVSVMLQYQIDNVVRDRNKLKAHLEGNETGKADTTGSTDHWQLVKQRFGVESQDGIHNTLICGRAIQSEYAEAWLQAIDWARNIVTDTLKQIRHCEWLAQQARLQNTPQVLRNLPTLTLLSQYHTTINNRMMRTIKTLNELRDRRAMDADCVDVH